MVHMPTPQLSHSTGSAPEIEADAQLLLLIPSPLDEGRLEAWAGLFDALRAVEFTGAAGSFSRVPLDGRTVAVAGVGPAADAAAYRDAAGAGLRALGGVETVVANAPGAPSGSWRAIAEGAGLGAYTFASYKKDGGKRRASRVHVVSDDEVADDEVAAAQSVVDAVALVTDLV
jgi:leucyl aminopeptidase